MDIYRCGMAVRANVGVPLPVFALLSFIIAVANDEHVVRYAVCVYSRSMHCKRDSARNVIQNSNIIHFNIHSEWNGKRVFAVVAVLHTAFCLTVSFSSFVFPVI